MQDIYSRRSVILCMKGIDAIFRKDERGNYNDKSRLYQDILVFGSTISKNEEFKLRDLARYLLSNNAEIRDQYKGSKSSECNTIEDIGQRVKRDVGALVNLQLMIKPRQEELGTELLRFINTLCSAISCRKLYYLYDQT